ncbi:Aquaporin-like protein [Niveomyces insectorum RCEF 264]|uniref:Aquaporin-like protein n=1 Tax=Niveomyces insectorum RCEF 264 TaxID=1081102 RepID=A0A167W708_9HYPO|nr:Aquaporin-like protein [Niveomyces insectorum RCEF 264]
MPPDPRQSMTPTNDEANELPPALSPAVPPERQALRQPSKATGGEHSVQVPADCAQGYGFASALYASGAPDMASGASGDNHLNKPTDFAGSFARTAVVDTSGHPRPWYLQRRYYIEGWADPSIWKAGVVEGVGACALIWLAGQFGMTLGTYSDREIGANAAIWGGALIASGIYATATTTGGHLNPLITWSTVTAGLCPVPRGVIYTGFQMVGGTLAGGLLLGTWGLPKTQAAHGSGCWFDPATLSAGQALLLEFCSSFFMVFLAFGLGLDPRQAAVFGPQLGPALVGVVFGVVVFVTTGTAPGYTGAGMNPARCFGYSVARHDFAYYWVWLLGPVLAAMLHGVLYNYVPPWYLSDDEARKKQRAA